MVGIIWKIHHILCAPDYSKFFFFRYHFPDGAVSLPNKFHKMQAFSSQFFRIFSFGFEFNWNISFENVHFPSGHSNSRHISQEISNEILFQLAILQYSRRRKKCWRILYIKYSSCAKHTSDSIPHIMGRIIITLQLDALLFTYAYVFAA